MTGSTIHAPTSLEGHAEPSILSYSRALLSDAKEKKKTYWYTEASAAVLSVVGSFLPWPRAAAVAGIFTVTAKVLGKFVLSSSRKAFRLGERARRYDFFYKTMGWSVPPADRADMVIAQSSSRIRAAAAKLATMEADYYAHKGEPSTERLLCNLCESMFWTERLMGYMSKARWGHFSISLAVVIAVLVGALVVDLGSAALIMLKVVMSVVTLLVAIDILGEARSFERGERESGNLLRAVVAEMHRSPLSCDEAMRLMVEYNCLLADLPLLPDSIYARHTNLLNKAWSEFSASLPIQCNVPG